MDKALVYFDKAERDRIRDALRRYMKDNRIGTPKLRDLITEANGMAARRDGKEPIALSTVQRFITDSHRANDSFVGLCARFAEGLPKADPILAFGQEAATFLGVELHRGAFLPVPPEIEGAFTCQVERAPVRVGKLWVRPRPGDSHYAPFSDMRIDALPGRPFAAIRETVANWTARGEGGIEPELATPPRRSYEGALIRSGGQLVALMRNTLLRTPRVYWLSLDEDGQLVGDGHEPFGDLDGAEMAGALHPHCMIVATRVAEGSDD
jgi:hypothetical protein